jgi:UDP-GlcNAc:undecaprenyl-phosphate GlcNAc-1-phosphate transferase
MPQYILAFLISFLCVIVLTPQVKRFALRYKIVDNPSARKVHKKPTPLLGGLAIFSAFAICLHIVVHPLPKEIQGLFLAGALVILLGLWDDYLGMKPGTKFLGQVLITLLVIFVFDIRSSIFNHDFHDLLDVGLSLLWIVGLTNSFNLLDNMDGLSAGIAGIAAFFFFILAAKAGQGALALTMAILAGSCAGFLIYNFSPASIFMGDMGSMFLGSTLAMTGVLVQIRSLNTWVLADSFPIQNYQVFTGIVPLLILGLPIFDTTLVTILRILNGRRISQGGKDHASHRLKMTRNALQRRIDKFIIGFIRLSNRRNKAQQHARHGIAHSRAVLMLYASEFAFGSMALLMAQVNLWQAVTILILVLVLAFLAAAKLAKVAVYEKQRSTR